MNPEDHLAVRRLLSAFPERPTDVLDETALDERRERITSHIRAIMAEPRAPQSQIWGRMKEPRVWGGLAMAAAVALTGRFFWTHESAVTPVATFRTLASQGEILCRKSTGSEWAPCEPRKEEALTGVRTMTQSSLSLETWIGVRVDVAESSTLLLGDATASARVSQITLALGRVDVRVPKLGTERSFSVLTPSATITVHGTAFSVDVAQNENGKFSTCVDLREGVVSVSAEGKVDRLVAPARWGCVAQSPADPARTVTASANPGSGESVPSSSALESVRPKSTLEQQTRLLQLALGAERRKDLATAEKLYRSLLSQYPNSIVAPEARAALERLSHQPSLSRP